MDQVWFMIVKADKSTFTKVNKFVEVANKVRRKLIFSIHEKPAKIKELYTCPYFEFFSHLSNYPKDKFFKFDDDVVYIRPRAFNYVVDTKKQF